MTITTGNGPYGLATYKNNLYVENYGDNTVSVYAPDGTPINTSLISGLSNPDGLAISGNNLYVANGGSNTVGVYTLNDAGTAVTSFNASLITQGLNGPGGLAIDAQGYIYVANQNVNTVGVYRADGTFVTTISNGFSAPTFVAISPDGQYLYVSNQQSCLVQIFWIGNGAQGMILQMMEYDYGMPALTSNDMVNYFMQGAHGTALNTMPIIAVQNAVSSTMKAMTPGTQITNFGGPVASVASLATQTAFEGGQTHSPAFNSFTPTQKQKFSYLSQQLPFLQFQSAQSLAEPIQPPLNYGATATPFEQPKITLKPVFLANEKSHVWIQPYGGLQRLESYDQVTGLSFKTGGTAFGAGYHVSDNVIMGVLTGGALSSYSQDQSSGTGSIDNAYLGLYGGYSKPEGGLNVDGSLIYGQSRYTADRNINALGLIAKNTHQGWDASGRVQVGYKVYYDSLSVDPFVALGYRYSYQNSYQETNAYPFNLNIPSSTNKTATIEIGGKFQQTMVVNDVLVKPLFGLSVLREHPVSKQANANISFSDTGNGFAVPVSTQIKTYATATLGCALMFTNDISISTLVTGKIKKHEQSVEALVKVSYAF